MVVNLTPRSPRPGGAAPGVVLVGSVAAAIGTGLSWVTFTDFGWVGTPPVALTVPAIWGLSWDRPALISLSVALVALSSLVVGRGRVRRGVATVMTILGLASVT